ncbi:MAG TPA: CHAT domain-containing protein, partial [Vicinamibacterales bacterium]|nr:CHAT domain-containing protein [Vicinamibacterales bacterium]
KADADLEHLRTHLQADEQKIAFLDDKMAVYESLVTACLTMPSLDNPAETAFGFIEKAKSRSLAELIAFRATAVPPKTFGRAADSVRRLREQLTWHYKEMELAELAQNGQSARRVKTLTQRVRTLERQLMGSLDEVGRTDQEFSALQSGRAAALDDIRACLPSDALLLEYYQARGRYYVCVVRRESLEVVPLAPAPAVHRLLRLLQFQISKFRLGPSYVEAFAAQFRTAAEMHLSELYAALVAPVRDRLHASHLVIVPHDVLHGLPFHALNDGRRFLGDEFTMSQAPSATVYRLCRTKPRSGAGAALVMGLPDEQTPFIVDEVAAISGVLPNAQVFMGEDATIERLQTQATDSRYVHIATHGQFRADNPMFSSIRLGDGPIGAYDLYQLRMSAELVTLSGCSTGRSVVAGGDEVLGLVRGLLYAGARAVLLTLWDTHDRTAAQFMKTFYGQLAAGWSMARAAQHAMWEIRDRYPHPFYWAPYTLIGDVQTAHTADRH